MPLQNLGADRGATAITLGDPQEAAATAYNPAAAADGYVAAYNPAAAADGYAAAVADNDQPGGSAWNLLGLMTLKRNKKK